MGSEIVMPRMGLTMETGTIVQLAQAGGRSRHGRRAFA